MSKRTGATASPRKTVAKAAPRSRGQSPSQQDLVAIRDLHAEGRTRADLAKLYGLSIYTITRIVNFKDHYALPAGDPSVVERTVPEVEGLSPPEDATFDTTAQEAAVAVEGVVPTVPLDRSDASDLLVSTFLHVVLESEDPAVERFDVVEEASTEVSSVVDTTPMVPGTDLVFHVPTLEEKKVEDALLTIIVADCRMVIVDPDFGRSRIDAQDVFRDFLADLHGPVRVEIGSADQAFRERIVSDLRNAMFHLSRNDIVVVRDNSYRIERVPSVMVDPVEATVPVVNVTVPAQPSCPTALILLARREEPPEQPVQFDEAIFVQDDAEGVAIADMLDTIQEEAEQAPVKSVFDDSEMSSDFGPEERRRGLRGFFGRFGRNRTKETA